MSYSHELWENAWMLFIMVAFWGSVSLIGLSLLRGLFTTSHPNPVTPPQLTPLEVAALRYARGEMSQSEYEQLVQTLRPPTA